MGLSWGPATDPEDRRDAADLDATALVFDGEILLDAVYFAQLTSADGSIRHHGAGMTSTGRGEGEAITVDLSRAHPWATTVIFIVTSYRRHTFDAIPNACCQVVDGISRNKLTHLDLTRAAHTGMVVAALRLTANGWALHHIGQPIAATHPVEAIPLLTEYLS